MELTGRQTSHHHPRGSSCPRTSSQVYSTWPPKRKPPPRGEGRVSICIRGKKSVLCCPGLRGLILGILAAEALHASSGIHQLLLAGEERMAGRADFYADIAFVGRPRDKRIAARAMHTHFVISGMNGCFHMGSDLNTNP